MPNEQQNENNHFENYDPEKNVGGLGIGCLYAFSIAVYTCIGAGIRENDWKTEAALVGITALVFGVSIGSLVLCLPPRLNQEGGGESALTAGFLLTIFAAPVGCFVFDRKPTYAETLVDELIGIAIFIAALSFLKGSHTVLKNLPNAINNLRTRSHSFFAPNTELTTIDIEAQKNEDDTNDDSSNEPVK